MASEMIAGGWEIESDDGNNNSVGEGASVVSSNALYDAGLYIGGRGARTSSSDNAGLHPEEKDPDFDKYFKIISKPDLTYEEEKNHLIALIKERRKILVKQLVLKMTEVGTGKSGVFKSLSKQYIRIKENKVKKQEEKGKEIKGNSVKEVG